MATLDTMSRTMQEKLDHLAINEACVDITNGVDRPHCVVNGAIMSFDVGGSGTSYTMSAYIVALMIECPNVDIAVFADGRRGADELMRHIITRMNIANVYFTEYPRHQYRVTVNQPRDCKSSVSLYTGERGPIRLCEGLTIILEPRRMPRDFWRREILQPLIGLRGSAVITINRRPIGVCPTIG